MVSGCKDTTFFYYFDKKMFKNNVKLTLTVLYELIYSFNEVVLTSKSTFFSLFINNWMKKIAKNC